ncbi:LexA family protein [Sphingobacterium cavernae]|uniref:LexA family protein n=1 Tax=Sphingobacterium cavernae TaxID=2592657 RepID=UPI0012300185|nr:translesion error-prone DNA polymerase V autoproteolytic subunit [Sphingobacterium cavernae]
MKVEIFNPENELALSLPFVINGISAGFPSPALDFEDSRIDLNKELIKHPLSTYYGRVKGMSLKNAGIEDGDIMVIDKSLPPTHGKIAVCFLDGEFTAKRILIENDRVILMPENDDYKPIIVTKENDFVVWGIVVYVIKAV